MTDAEKIQVQLHEMMAGAGGMLSVRTVFVIMERLLQDEPEMMIGGAKIYLSTIARRAKDLSEEIERWTYKGRVSEALFDYHYIGSGKDDYGIYADLKVVLMKLDAAYQDQFRIASAIRYLLKVSECAGILSRELKEEN